MTGDDMTFSEADTDQDESLSQAELEALTKAQILAIATEKGYTTVNASMTKAEMITAFLAAQEAAAGQQ